MGRGRSGEVLGGKKQKNHGILATKKVEESYKSWIKKLQKKYVVSINQAQWEKIRTIETE